MIVFNEEIQRQVVALGLDDFSPNAMLPNLHGGQYGTTPETWRKNVVDFVRSMLDAGLIAAIPGIEAYQEKNADEITRILQEGDERNGLHVELVWDVIHFSATQELSSLLKMTGLTDWGALDAELSLPLGRALAEKNIVVL
ncbi:hypothetical protein [Massilia sp. YMA4]|uniref:hypothetical protein n=1 Tax=Massilia sp. YMA4 TaxID=1593482 RepID=UPI0015819A8D|nr:hypothetical protein [Massilia sp. YMA4]